MQAQLLSGMWDLSSLELSSKEQTFAICKCFALQSRSLTTGPPKKSLYLPFNTYYVFIILDTVHSPCRYRFSLGFKFLLTSDLLKNISYLGLLVVMQSCSCCMSEKVLYLLFDMYFSWVQNSVSIIFISAFKTWFQCPLANIVSFA